MNMSIIINLPQLWTCMPPGTPRWAKSDTENEGFVSKLKKMFTKSSGKNSQIRFEERFL